MILLVVEVVEVAVVSVVVVVASTHHDASCAHDMIYKVL